MMRTSVLFWVAFGFAAAPAAQTPVAQPSHAKPSAVEPLTAQTLPVSPTVLATVASRPQRLELLVLWRGAAGWYLSGARNGATYGERGGSVEATITYGGVTLRLSFDAQNCRVTLQGVTRSLPAGTNVLLVDGAESPHGPRIAGTLAVPVAGPIDPRTRTLAPFLKRSPEMMAFLQCDAATSDRDRASRGIVCDDQERP
jgi:hypothetical protein